jgi:hypothetical protein
MKRELKHRLSTYSTNDHHCLEEIVGFVNIGRIVDHHCLEEIVRFVNIGRIVDNR